MPLSQSIRTVVHKVQRLHQTLLQARYVELFWKQRSKYKWEPYLSHSVILSIPDRLGVIEKKGGERRVPVESVLKGGHWRRLASIMFLTECAPKVWPTAHNFCNCYDRTLPPTWTNTKSHEACDSTCCCNVIDFENEMLEREVSIAYSFPCF